MEATHSIIPTQPHPIPLDLRKELPELLDSLAISKRIFGEMKQQNETYKKVQILPTDPEWRFVWKYFYHDKPKRWGIKQMYCVHERHQQQTFELNLSSIEREAAKFKPTWDQEPRAPQRAQAIERWKEATNIFSPFNTLENDGRRRDWKETKILPLWHGSSEKPPTPSPNQALSTLAKPRLEEPSPKVPTKASLEAASTLQTAPATQPTSTAPDTSSWLGYRCGNPFPSSETICKAT